MSSDSKIKFNTSASSKGAGDTITSETVTMPNHSENHILNVKADSSCSGEVDVQLEMSPDGTNWCPAVTRTVSGNSASSTGNVIGNQESVKLTPDAGEFKNKHARGGLNFNTSGVVVTPDGSGTRDLMHQHIATSKSFNYSQWFKTSELPSTGQNETVTFAVTVVSTGYGNKYYIDGVQQPTLNLKEGSTYTFDQSHASNATHALKISTTSNGTHGGGSEYTTGVTIYGTPGSSGAYTRIVVAASAPTVHYYCGNHSGMGGQALTPTNNIYKPVLFRHGGHDTFENTKNIKLDEESGAGTVTNTQNSMGLEYEPSTIAGVTGLTPDASFTVVRWVDLNLIASGTLSADTSFVATNNTGIYLRDTFRSIGDRMYVYLQWRNGVAPFNGGQYFDIPDYTKAICIIKRNDASAGVGNTGVAHIDVIDSDGTSLYNHQIDYTIPSGYTISGNTWTSQSGISNVDELAILNTFVADGNLNTLYKTVGSNIKPTDFTSHANLIDWYRFGTPDTKALVTPVNGSFPTLTNSGFTSSDAIPALATSANLYSSGATETTQNLVEPKSTYTTVLNRSVASTNGSENLEILTGTAAATHFGSTGLLTDHTEQNLGRVFLSKFKPDVDYSTSRWIYLRSDGNKAGWRARAFSIHAPSDGYINTHPYLSSGSYSRLGGLFKTNQGICYSATAGDARYLDIVPVIAGESASYWYVYDSNTLLTFTHYGTSTTFTADLSAGFHMATTYDAPAYPENGIPESAVALYVNGNRVKIHTTTESGTDYVDGYAPADNYFKGDEVYMHSAPGTYTHARYFENGYSSFSLNQINNHLDFARVLTAAEASKLYNGGKLLDFTDLSTNAAFPVSKTGLIRAYDADERLPHRGGGTDTAGFKDVSGYGLNVYEYSGLITSNKSTVSTVSPALGFMATPSLSLTLFKAASSFSISGWFKTTDTGVLFSNTGGAVATGMTMKITSTGTLLDHHDSNVALPSTTVVNDGNWHHIVFTYTSGSQKTFIDGVEITSTTSSSLTDDDIGGSNGFTLLGDGQHNAHATSPAASDTSKLSASISNWSIHSEVLSATAVNQIYSNGNVRNIKNLPSITENAIKAWWQLQDPTTPEQDSSGVTGSLVYEDGASATLVSKLATATGEVLAEDVINGNAMTMSLTKSFNFTTNKWVGTADQNTALCLSFNGFEEQAEYFAIWKCTQTVAGATIDICDGGWHNVILSYRGKNNLSGDNVDPGDTVKFGPGPAGSLPYNWALSFDGQPLTSIKDGSGADYVGGLNTIVTDTYNTTSYNVGFAIQDRHLKYETSNTQEVYKPHAQFSAGIHEVVGVGNTTAFQGYVDETSFHSDNWWVDQAGTSILTSTYNAEKPATIFGNTTALNNRQGSSTEYPEGKPYPLLNPEKLTTSGLAADIQGSNQYISPLRYDASTNTAGGLEGWWRWGDTPGDCSITINDVKDHNDSINARDISAFGIVTADRQVMTSADSIFLSDTTASSGGGTSITFPQVIVENIQVGICNLKQMASPVLQYLRVKFTGAGSCNLGENSVQAQINFEIKD